MCKKPDSYSSYTFSAHSKGMSSLADDLKILYLFQSSLSDNSWNEILLSGTDVSEYIAHSIPLIPVVKNSHKHMQSRI